MPANDLPYYHVKDACICLPRTHATSISRTLRTSQRLISTSTLVAQMNLQNVKHSGVNKCSLHWSLWH